VLDDDEGASAVDCTAEDDEEAGQPVVCHAVRHAGLCDSIDVDCAALNDLPASGAHEEGTAGYMVIDFYEPAIGGQMMTLPFNSHRSRTCNNWRALGLLCRRFGLCDVFHVVCCCKPPVA
jgi:hypothetical protein